MRTASIAIAMSLAVALAGCSNDDASPAATGEPSAVEPTETLAAATVAEDVEVGLIYFGAPWCPPCRVQGPIVDGIAEEYGGRVMVMKVNVDERPDLAARHGVRAVPTMVVMKGDEVQTALAGLQQAPRLRAELDRALGNN